jgi:hypothetical protein
VRAVAVIVERGALNRFESNDLVIAPDLFQAVAAAIVPALPIAEQYAEIFPVPTP